MHDITINTKHYADMEYYSVVIDIDKDVFMATDRNGEFITYKTFSNAAECILFVHNNYKAIM